MAKARKLGSVKRFGPRYGDHLKQKVAIIEQGHLGRQSCPYCGKKQVKREAAGIWECGFCKVRFAGRAYSMGKGHEVEE